MRTASSRPVSERAIVASPSPGERARDHADQTTFGVLDRNAGDLVLDQELGELGDRHVVAHLENLGVHHVFCGQFSHRYLRADAKEIASAGGSKLRLATPQHTARSGWT